MEAMAHLPVVDHTAQLVGRPVEEGALFGAQLDRRNGFQSGPVGRPGEQLGIETDGTGFESLGFRVGYAWQDLADLGEDRGDDEAPANGGYRQGGQCNER